MRPGKLLEAKQVNFCANRWEGLIELWRKPAGMRASLVAIVLTLLISAVAALVYVTGGTTFAWLHLMYIPVLLGAVFFGVSGGLVAAVFAGFLLGPFMPLSVADAIAQDTGNWLFRTFFFLLIGGIAGGLFHILNGYLDRMKQQACVDDLTGLPNLLALERAVDEIFADRNASICLAMITCTNFANIMDALTYRVANTLEQQIAKRLEQVNHFGWPAYKIQSTSFAFIARNVPVEQFKADCEQILYQLQEPFIVEGVLVAVNTHCGIALLPKDASKIHEGLQKASVAAHEAERQNKLCVLWKSEDDIDRKRRLGLLGSLSDALKNEELMLYYQPKVNVQTGFIEGAEALLRWNHPEHGLVRPDLFIPEAEKTWLVQPLALFAVKAVIAKLQQLRSQGIFLRLGVNLTAHNIQSVRFVAELNRMIDAADLLPGSLEVEITERTLITEVDIAADVLNSLKKRGVSIALDDMGSGYSVIRYLQELPINSVKLDKIFIQDLLGSEINQNIVRDMIVMAKRIGITVVTEGVENQEVSDKLRELGCDLIQGYYVSRPLPDEEFDSWLQNCAWKLNPVGTRVDKESVESLAS
jgi:EAL domain-containing protein (putative c-di-GMP-specific phosphodiesterase class I)/GGDEF domain-containing protein